jgi:DNA-binding response OmpR family regulator
MSDSPKILIVDDETAIVETLRFNLKRNGYRVLTAGDGRMGVSLAMLEKPDLIVLDIMLPLLDGIETCKEIRKVSRVPIIMLTARDEEIDKVLALELGADDYMTKPFGLHEFMARVRALLRRVAPSEIKEARIEVGEVVLDTAAQKVMVGGEEIPLAPKEFSLLQILMENRGRVVTRQVLLERIWGHDFDGDQQTISVHIRWLREKIEADANAPRYILTIRGRGYLFRNT